MWLFFWNIFKNHFFSILKYEPCANGANRKLIVKNIRRQDVGEYVCKSGESAVTVKLTVGAKTSSGATLKGKLLFLLVYGKVRLDWQGVRNSWQGVLWQTQMNMPTNNYNSYVEMISTAA